MLELSRADAERWLCAGLSLLRLSEPTAEALAKASPWLLALLAERTSLPPVGVVGDVGALLAGARFDPLATHAGWPDALTGALRVYEDSVLARLAASPRLLAMQDALLRLPESDRATAVALVVDQLLERLSWREGSALNLATARRVCERPAEEILATGREALWSDAALVTRLTEEYLRLARLARSANALVGDSEVFLLENLAVLKSKAQRVAVAQVVDAAEELERALPRRMKPRGPSKGVVPTEVDDEASYPIGGFSSVSNSGSLENLVTSELAYMDDDASLDLFDVRYVESELLYYTRDESVFVRSRRVVWLVLNPSLVRARFKDVGARWQRLVTLLGLLLAAVRKLTAWLNEAEGLQIRIAFVREEHGATPLLAERELCQLLFREWLERGVVEICEVSTLGEVLERAKQDERSGRVDVLAASAKSRELQGLPDQSLQLILEDAAPRLSPDVTGWAEVTRAVLQALL